MERLAREERSKREQYYQQQYSNLFGNNTVAIKEEDKDVYKRMKRILIKNFHPDVNKDAKGNEVDLINDLFKTIRM